MKLSRTDSEQIDEVHDTKEEDISKVNKGDILKLIREIRDHFLIYFNEVAMNLSTAESATKENVIARYFQSNFDI